MRDIHIAPVAPAGAHADEVDFCIRSYYDDLEPLFGAELTLEKYPLPEGLEPPTGVFLMARRSDPRRGDSGIGDDSAGEPVGCGTLSTLEEGVGYISRMWVHESARGLGLGGRLLGELERHAREFGHHTIRLYTHRNLAAAQKLYRRKGYVEVDPFFEDAPFADHFFEKFLDRA